MTNEHRRMTSSRLALLLTTTLAGAACGSLTKPNPLSCLDGHCSDPAHPVCDVDGSLAGTAGVCIAIECTPLSFETCRGEDALICNSTGDNYDLTRCEFGCDDGAGGCKQCTPGTPNCDVHIIPKYLPTVCDQSATIANLTIAAPTTLNTDVDANCNGGVVEQLNGPSICVARYGAIAIERNQTLIVAGKRAIALVADNALTVDGLLDVSGSRSADGPGGGLVSSGGSAAPPSGCGGAGFHTQGGAGGSIQSDGGAANGGVAGLDPAQLAVLVGGNRAQFIQAFSSGGGGAGGAATLVSCRGTVSMLGLVDAGGGGGQGGYDFAGLVAAGGGGSGGHVVFQGMMVVVTGEVFANGGGGGVGLDHSMTGLGTGEDGTRSATTSAQGGLQQGIEGAGGAGGRQGMPPGPGRMPLSQFGRGGAGGGSTGFLQVYTPTGVTPNLTPLAASPSFQPSGTIPTN